MNPREIKTLRNPNTTENCIKELKVILEELLKKPEANGKLMQSAFTYFQWNQVMAYREDGHFDIDNSIAERSKSIERVFAPIIKNMEHNGYVVQSSFARSSRMWPLVTNANIVRYAIKSYCGGIYHITGDVQYVACLMNPEKTIMTIHDCVTLHNENAPSWLKKLVYEFGTRFLSKDSNI